MIKTLSISTARRQFADITAHAHLKDEIFLIVKQKRPTALILGARYYPTVLEFLESKRAEEKIKKEKPTCLSVLEELQSSASIPPDFSARHDWYLAEVYDTSPAKRARKR